MACNTLMERLLAVARVKLNSDTVFIRDEQVWVGAALPDHGDANGAQEHGLALLGELLAVV